MSIDFGEKAFAINSGSCHSSVAGVIYNLRQKIEPDSKNPTYIKTVLGVGYKFNGKHREMMIDTLSFPGVFFCYSRKFERLPNTQKFYTSSPAES